MASNASARAGGLARPWGRLAFTDRRGAGVPLVCLHGTGCDQRDWLPLAQFLPGDIRLVTLDFRGHGDSAVPATPFSLSDLAEDVQALLEHLGLEWAWLVGHSLGGMVAIDALRRPERLAGLILLEGWTRLGASREAFRGERFYGALPEEARQQIAAKAERTRARCDRRVWESFWRTVQAYDGWPALAAARLPVLEVYGGMGRTSGARAALLVPDNPHIRWAWIDGAGHYLAQERPAAVARLIREALGRGAAAG